MLSVTVCTVGYICLSCGYQICVDFVSLLSMIIYEVLYTLGECMALWGEPNELSIQHRVYILMQYADS